MGLKEFKQHLADPSPGFRCSTQPRRKIFLVRHKLAKKASAGQLQRLRVLLGPKASAQLVHFYRAHDGADLYRCGGNSAIRFFPISEWERKTVECFGDQDEVDDWGKRTNVVKKGVVFAEIPRSGNYFFLQTTGKLAGAVFYANHDNVRRKPFAKSFDSFLDLIRLDPQKFISLTGGYLRYGTSGKDNVWIPEAYLSPARRTWVL